MLDYITSAHIPTYTNTYIHNYAIHKHTQTHMHTHTHAQKGKYTNTPLHAYTPT